MARSTGRRPPPGALVAVDLSKSYGDAVAVGPVDVTIGRGEAVALIGHNGSGKSTLLRLAAGLADPSGGEVTIAGHPAGSLEARARLAYVPDAQVLLIDEPFVGIDAAGRAALEELDERRADGTTVVVATHELGLAERFDRCVALRYGQVVHDGPIDSGDAVPLAG